MIHIYCGNGKGKSTCACGLALRYSSYGKVFYYQFLKNGESGEVQAFKEINNIYIYMGYCTNKFSFQMTESEIHEAESSYATDMKSIFKRAKDYDMIVLDEAITAVNLGFLDEDVLIEFLNQFKNDKEIVLTGRNPSQEICEIADYISEIKKIKHPYDNGTAARKGIEF